MPRQRKSTPIAMPREAPEDFKQIHGIGPAIEKRLHRAGICTFSELVALTAEEISSILPGVSAKKISAQSWIPQARKLIPRKAEDRSQNNLPVIQTSHQHYENFTFEFLLDEKNKIRRLRVIHVQSGDVDSWSKWDSQRLIDFLSRHTRARLPTLKMPNSPREALKPAPQSSLAEQPASRITEIDHQERVPVPENNIDQTPPPPISMTVSAMHGPTDQPPLTTVVQPLMSPAASVSTANKIHLIKWKNCLSNSKHALTSIPHDQAFDVNFTLDLTQVSPSQTSQMDITASLYAKKLGGGVRQAIRETHQTLPYSDIIDLAISNAMLPEGFYRLEIFLTLLLTGSSPSTDTRLSASFQGGLLQVY